MSSLTIFLAILSFSTAAVYAGLRARVFPAFFMQIWFTATIGITVIFLDLFTFFVDFPRHIGLVSLASSRNACEIVSHLFFSAFLLFNPQVRLHVDSKIRDFEGTFAEIPNQSILLINHTSFFDSVLFAAISPTGYIYNCRTLLKNSLRKIPFFGRVCDRVGHFPVFIVQDHGDSFSVDREQQARVTREIGEHLRDVKGKLAFFPEGRMNIAPRVLLPFRRGSFGLVLEGRYELFYMLSINGEKVWPIKSTLPKGGAVDVFVRIGRIEYDQNINAEELSTIVREKMQSELDAFHKDILKKREGRIKENKAK